MRDRGATRALVLGILSLPFGVLAPFAIWTGISSLRRIRGAHGGLAGAWTAIAGLVSGAVGLAALLAGLGYWVITSA